MQVRRRTVQGLIHNLGNVSLGWDNKRKTEEWGNIRKAMGGSASQEKITGRGGRAGKRWEERGSEGGTAT